MLRKCHDGLYKDSKMGDRRKGKAKRGRSDQVYLSANGSFLVFANNRHLSSFNLVVSPLIGIAIFT